MRQQHTYKIMCTYIKSEMVLTYDVILVLIFIPFPSHLSSSYPLFSPYLDPFIIFSPSPSFIPCFLSSSLLLRPSFLPFRPSSPSFPEKGVDLQSSMQWSSLLEHHRMLIQQARVERQLPVVGRGLQVWRVCMWAELTSGII